MANVDKKASFAKVFEITAAYQINMASNVAVKPNQLNARIKIEHTKLLHTYTYTYTAIQSRFPPTSITDHKL